MASRWSGLTIDCADAHALATFWSALLERCPSLEHDEPGWASIGSRLDEQPRITFQEVPEPRTAKVRIHLDVEVDSIDSGRAQVERLGGRWTGERHDYPGQGVVMVMADPEGNEFCLVEYFD